MTSAARLVLFDLDGTLLLTRRAGWEAMLEACEALFGRRFRHEHTRIDGNLDPVIWRGLCAENDIADPERHHDRFRSEYAARLAAKLADPARTERLPGTLELVDALEREPGVALGVLTGNYPETGARKLLAAGFDPARFPTAAWGSDAPNRPALLPVALARHRAARGVELAPERVVVIGDTPWDVECAKTHGARSLAVATGRYDVDTLARAGSDLAVRELADTAQLVAWILGR
ncbi:MAG: haloacid dehalogenase-like hydrolase [Planctomycetes bacterium]|nr:haloacid dehalogenase-like hydrolase [Planctomycetota bacterium]